MGNISTSFWVFLWMSFILISSSCKKQYEGPPDMSGFDPDLPVTHTLAQLQLLPAGVITDDVIISGIVVMDDRSGNYFQKIVIQDATGGMELLITQSNLYHDYPIGRKIYVRCKGLYIGADGGNPQLGFIPDAAGILSGIPSVLVGNYVVKANYPNEIIPDTISLAQLYYPPAARRYWNTLIVIKDVEFGEQYMAVPYAQPSGFASATSLKINDCNGKSINLWSSGYAKFQPYFTPVGNGIISGIYTHYQNASGTIDEARLAIRDTSDLHFYAARCDGSLPGNHAITSIAAIRSLVPTFNDSINNLSFANIAGIVISDKNAGNIAPTDIILQSSGKGILIRFEGTPSFLLGDSLVVNIEGGKLSWVNNLLQLSNIAAIKASRKASGIVVIPKVVTIAEAVSNYPELESTLVKIEQVTLTGSPNYSGNKTMTDGTGNLILFTRSAATFAGQPFAYVPKSYTGILSVFNTTKQMQLRNLNDVQ